LKNKKQVIIGSLVVLALILVIATIGWTRYRFSKISLCTTCHEIFVPFDEYMPHGELSSSDEDFKPSKPFSPGLFKVSVGCGECHMYPYEEYRESAHYENDLDVKPGCVGCHEPHSVFKIVRWKFLFLNNGAYGKSPFDALSNSLRDVPEWEELRIKLAKRVREQMLKEGSAKCRVCHKTNGNWFSEIKRHRSMKEKGQTCIECHYNLVHEDVEWPEMEG